MGQNLLVLGISAGVGVIVGLIALVASSQSVRRHGVLGTLRRHFSDGASRSHYLG